jgi:cyanate permease
MAIRAPVSLAAPVFAGWVFDTTGNYRIALGAFLLSGIVASILMCMIRPVKQKNDA